MSTETTDGTQAKKLLLERKTEKQEWLLPSFLRYTHSQKNILNLFIYYLYLNKRLDCY